MSLIKTVDVVGVPVPQESSTLLLGVNDQRPPVEWRMCSVRAQDTYH